MIRFTPTLAPPVTCWMWSSRKGLTALPRMPASAAATRAASRAPLSTSGSSWSAGASGFATSSADCSPNAALAAMMAATSCGLSTHQSRS